MPTIALTGQDQEQWTHGSPSSLSNMLLNGFMFLQEATTVKDKAKHMVDGVDATPAYTKVFTNITNMFSPMGNAKLRSGTLKDKSNQFLDYSALLGAYFRSSINGKDGEPIVGLTDDQLAAVYKFIQPLVPADSTPKAYLEGLVGTPSAKHKAVLKELLFLGVTPEERESMFKSKYRTKADDFIDSMLSVADFMRTPFSVLDAQEGAEVAAAKKLGVVVKTSGVDLQWSSMQKGVKGAMDAVLTVKKGAPSPDVKKSHDTVEDISQQLNGSFGIANARYQLIKEFNEERQAYQEAQRLALVEIASLKEQLTVLKSKLQGAEEVAPQLPALQTKVAEVNEENVRLKQEKQELHQTLLEVRAQLSSLQVQVQRVESESVDITLAKQNLEESLVDLRQKVKFYEQRIAELESPPVSRAEPHREEVGVGSLPRRVDDEAAIRLRSTLRGEIVELASHAGNDKNLKAYCKEQLEKLEASDPQALQAMQKEIKQLTGITQAVNTIVSTLRADTGIFSFGVSDKAIAVEKAMAEIPPKDRVQLLDYQQVKGKNSEYPQINGLFDALLHQRAYIFKSKEATSFKTFKEKMDNIKESTEQELDSGLNAHHSNA